MNFKDIKRIFVAGASAGILVWGTAACVTVDTGLGQDYMPLEQQYDIFTCEWELEQMSQKRPTELSGYNTRRFTIGSIMDAEHGLTRKGSAFSLIPIVDTLDFGKNPKVREFHFTAIRDTINIPDERYRNILQNVNVYAFENSGKVLDSLSFTGELRNSDFSGCERITRGVPVYDGGDSLSFKFSDSWSNSLIQRFVDNSEDGVYILDSIPEYMEKVLPGIYICTDDASGDGGRIDMFNVAIKIENNYVMGNYAELKFSAEYDGEMRDSSFIFIFGAVAVPENASNLPNQYAFNCTEIVGGCAEGPATDILYVEGGDGVKPVVSAKELHSLLNQELRNNPNILEYGIDLNQVIINKASLELPFIMPEDYTKMEIYPEILSPCCRLLVKDSLGVSHYTYANLTDASISSEKHGAVDRSNIRYDADISFHTQKMLSLGEEPSDSTLANYDIWFLITKNEINETSSSSSSSSYDDYLNQMYYYNYLNQLYGGYGGYGYGGYGYGYGGYGSYGNYGYNNYYSMMLYSNMLNSSSSGSTTSTSEELDRDRFYAAKLCGPQNESRRPKLKISYSVPKRAIK